MQLNKGNQTVSTPNDRILVSKVSRLFSSRNFGHTMAPKDELIMKNIGWGNQFICK